MDAIVSRLQDLFEGQIDFEGQQISELLCNVLLTVTGVFAFLVGYLQEDIYLTLWIGLAGTAITALIVIPPWPAFKEHPEPWLPGKNALTGMPRGGIVMDVSGKR